MKRLFGIFVVLAGVVALLVGMHRTSQQKVEDAEKAKALSSLRSDYLERVGWLRTNPDEAAYRNEVNTFFGWYFDQVNAYQKRFHGNPEFDDYLAELDRRAAKGGKEQALADKKAYFDYVKKAFDTFRQRSYRPVWTSTSNGMRLDVASSDVVMVLGKPQVRLALVLWGPQRELREDGRMKKMVTSASFSVTWKLYDAKGKLYGEMTAQGDPSMKVDWPERFIAEFPPQMLLGHFDMDLLPANVARTEITFNVTSNAPSGGTVNSTYAWKLETPAEWRLKPGEKWDGAQETTRSEDEINAAR
jgi:hypothetical protein